jgi:hypothetical protein
MRKWILPEYIEDILPAEAERMESLRRMQMFRARFRATAARRASRSP